MGLLRKLIVPVVLLILVVSLALVLFNGSNDKQLTAFFPRTISLYPGSDVRILGVPVGKVDSVTPMGKDVKVVMHYDDDIKVPSDAKAVVVAPAIVGDRYVQLTPAYQGKGAVLADNTVLQENRTAEPLELDQIYKSLDQLTVALGPEGANKTGALSDLLKVTAANFGGEGEQFNRTIHNFAQLSTTLADNKEELFGSAKKLQGFISKLAANDGTVRHFNSSLSRISGVLAGDRKDLAAALKNLGIGLNAVGDFVRDNRSSLKRNIDGLNRVAKVFVKERAAFDQTLRIAPLALNNLAGTYNPQTGTLDTAGNVGMLGQQLTDDPKSVLCALIASNDSSGSGCKLIKSLPLPRTAPLGAGSGSFYGAPFDPTLHGLVGGTK